MNSNLQIKENNPFCLLRHQLCIIFNNMFQVSLMLVLSIKSSLPGVNLHFEVVGLFAKSFQFIFPTHTTLKLLILNSFNFPSKLVYKI